LRSLPSFFLSSPPPLGHGSAHLAARLPQCGCVLLGPQILSQVCIHRLSLALFTRLRYIRQRFAPLLPFSSMSSTVSYSDYPSPLLPTLVAVVNPSSSPPGDHDLNDAINPLEDPVPPATPLGSFQSDADPRARIRQQSSGERILRFSPTVSVKYFKKEKHVPSSGYGGSECIPIPGASSSTAGSERIVEDDVSSPL
jgi:hypothetical protein